MIKKDSPTSVDCPIRYVLYFYSFFIFFLCLKRVSLPATGNRFELFHTDIPCILFLTFKLTLFMLHMYRYYIRLCLCRKSGTFQKSGYRFR